MFVTWVVVCTSFILVVAVVVLQRLEIGRIEQQLQEALDAKDKVIDDWLEEAGENNDMYWKWTAGKNKIADLQGEVTCLAKDLAAALAREEKIKAVVLGEPSLN